MEERTREDYLGQDLNHSPKVVVVVPALNEEKNIISLINAVKKYAELIIVVDDGSMDRTATWARETGAIVVSHRRNRGKGLALKTGLLESVKHNPDIIVTIDADGQHDPNEIPKLMAPILEGKSDIVVGSRFLEKGIYRIPAFRSFGLSMIHVTSKLLIKSCIRDNQSGFRAYNKSVFELISHYEASGFGVETEQIAKAEYQGFRVSEVPVSIKYKGIDNSSKLNPVVHGATIISTIVRIAIKRRPLRLIGIPGFLCVFLGLLTMTQMLLLFNEYRYFSVPLAIITLGFFVLGIVLVLMAIVFQELKIMRESLSPTNGPRYFL